MRLSYYLLHIRTGLLMNKILSSIVNYIKTTDKLLFILTIATTGYGLLVLYGVLKAFDFGLRGLYIQIAGAVLGLICAIILSKMDYKFLAKLWKLHVPLAYALVFATFILGYGRAGADDINWIALPFGASIQPSEFLKISFILSFAFHLDKVKENINAPLTLLPLLIHGAVPALLIHFQGDDGTVLVFIFIFAAMLFAAGLSLRYVAVAAGLGLIAIPVAWNYLLSNDQKMRFQAIFTPGIDPKGIEWQQNSALISIGSGQLSGNGIFTTHRFVDEIQNDFIFAFIGESFGLMGCIAAVVLIFAVAAKVLFISRMAKDTLGNSICIGIFTMLTTQTIVNVGMNIKLLPVIGITLPFFSKGGSSILSAFLAIGLALSVYMHNKENLFLDKNY